MTINYAQIFCTTKDVFDDMESPGGDVVRAFQAVRDASDYIAKEIGHFIPVTEARTLGGNGKKVLSIPPIVYIASVVHDGTTLVENTDFLAYLYRRWNNGPYVELNILPDATQITCWLNELNAIVLTGRWGKYEKSTSTGATVADATEQNSSQATLKVSNGSAAHPGMTLLIGSEQELVTGYSTPTASVTTLGAALTADADVVTLADGTLVNEGETIRVDFEQMLVREVQSNQAAVIRGWNRTARTSHSNSTAVAVYRTFAVERGVNGTTAAAHANGVSISRYDPPDDIRFLTRQIATLMLNKARSGYQGKTGNAETGTVFYNDAFPRYELERIKAAYEIYT